MHDARRTIMGMKDGVRGHRRKGIRTHDSLDRDR